MRLTDEQFARLFPFHLLIDGKMRIIATGAALARVLPDLSIGSPVSNHFALQRLGSDPSALIDREVILSQRRTLFILKSRTCEITLRYEVIPFEDPEQYLFIGSPWVRNPTELRGLGIVLSDFSLHDSTVDLLQLVQTATISLRDAKDIAARLEMQRNDLKAMIDTAGGPILAMDVQGRIIEWNKTAERMIGDSRTKALGRQFIGAYVDPSSQADVQQLLDEVLAGQLGSAPEAWLRSPSGSRSLVLFSGSPRHDSAGGVIGITLIGQDITELGEHRTTLESRVAERTEQLSRANAELSRVMRSKDDFLSAMSHELRTPLNTIIGMSESLTEGTYGGLTEAQRKSIETITESGQHLLSLINDLLDVAKIGAGKLELSKTRLRVADVCHSSLRLVMQLAHSKSQRVTVELDPSAQFIEADDRRLKQILVNLLGNAVKFTPNGGTITLKTGLDASDECLVFRVVDTGIGISPADMGRLFTPFTQIDSGLTREYAGTGLGLTLVMRLAELHGGSVAVESELDKGSCFSVRLPLGAIAASCGHSHPDLIETDAPERTLAGRNTEGGQGPLIVLADDNELSLMTFGDYLRANGFQVAEARNGLEAVRIVSERLPALVLMDVQMPVLDGLEAIRRIRSVRTLDRIPIVALTSRAMVGDRERCLEAGASQYLSKPVGLKKLLASVTEELLGSGRGTPASGSTAHGD